MIKIAVIIACHNRKDKTLSCLNSLYIQNGLNVYFEIKVYLLDDASTDGTSSAVSSLYPDVVIISGNGHLYWNRGMFVAWKEAMKMRHDCYLWLNDDTYLYNDAILVMLRCGESTNMRSIICGTVESPLEKGVVTYGGGKIVANRFVPNYPTGKEELCVLINGNCVFIPNYVCNLVGNLDWKFTHAIGDHDYGLRAKKMGIKCYSTGKFVASCALNPKPPKWCRRDVKFIERARNLYSPLGYNQPILFLLYEIRHFGYLVAIKHFISIHLRMFFPILWK